MSTRVAGETSSISPVSSKTTPASTAHATGRSFRQPDGGTTPVYSSGVSFERPVRCDFVVNLDVREHGSDPLRAALPLLLAASRLVFVLDGQIDAEWPLVWIDAPVAREPVLELLTAVGV